jgi:hypothetical protein
LLPVLLRAANVPPTPDRFQSLFHPQSTARVRSKLLAARKHASLTCV